MLNILLSHLDVIVPTLLALGTWVWTHLRGEKTTSVTDMLKSVALQAAHEFLDGHPDDVTTFKAYATQKLTQLATSLKLPAALINLVVPQAVEYGLAELLQVMTDRDHAIAAAQAGMPAKLAEMFAKSQSVLMAFNAPPIVPPLDPPIANVTLVPPEASPK